MATTRRATTPSRNGGSTANGRRSSARSPEPRLGQRAPELQKFGSLRLLPIALSAEARRESSQILNQVLADTTILYALYKKHHWLVAGPTFYQLHLLFDKHAEEQLELIDLLAERVQSLGGIAVGDPRHAAELTTVPRPPDGAEEVPVMIDRLLDAHEIIIEKVRKGLDATEKNKDLGTNDLLMGDVLRRHELQVWFIAEHLVDVPLTEA
jgi:starvation-inducible DNA-binding protein